MAGTARIRRTVVWGIACGASVLVLRVVLPRLVQRGPPALPRVLAARLGIEPEPAMLDPTRPAVARGSLSPQRLPVWEPPDSGLALVWPDPGPLARHRKARDTDPEIIVCGGNDVGPLHACQARGVPPAVLEGLTWLARHQGPDGRWQAAARPGRTDATPSGLALLAFLGAGYTHLSPACGEEVKRGLRFLIREQDLGGRRGAGSLDRPIAALALCVAYHRSRSPLLRGPAEKAIRQLTSDRSAAPHDVSVVGWTAMALRAGRDAGLRLEGLDEALREAHTHIESLAARTAAGSAQHALIAIAMIDRVSSGALGSDARLRAGARVLAESSPVWDAGGPGRPSRMDYHAWFHGTRALFVMGGDYWRMWGRPLHSALVDHQRTKGDDRGSWDPLDAWGRDRGRACVTAINLLSLEIYYRCPAASHLLWG